MLQESGGQDATSEAAWEIDPLQVNASKFDWNEYKTGLGLKKSEAGGGDFKTNLKAGIIMMIRKGFGVSGQPPMNRPSGTFDGLEKALQRYNGRDEQTTNSLPYDKNYEDKIIQRYRNPTVVTPIQLPQPEE
ncbi:MAG: hypothetical protein ACREBB_10870 [Nitrosotalea sp.]